MPRRRLDRTSALTLLAVPYHLGHEGVGMGAGPAAIAPDAERVELREHPGHEVGACLALNRLVAERVGEGDVVLAGGCHVARGVVGAVGVEGLGVLWLDSHGDFHTAETSRTGYFDGCALALACGVGWEAASAGLAAAAPERVVHVGGRDFDPGERERMEAAGVRFGPAAVAEVGAQRWYVHLDLDVLGRANVLAAPGGMPAAEVAEVLGALPGRVVAASVTAYDPPYDPDGTILGAARELLAVLHPAQVKARGAQGRWPVSA